MTSVDLSKYSSILFDLDGTILNSEPLHMKALSRVLKQFKIRISLKQLDCDYHGLDDTAVYQSLTTKYPQLLLGQEDFLIQKNIFYIEELNNLKDEKLEKLITPGFRDFLEKIKLTHKLGVVSASEESVVLATLKRLKILQDFSIIEFRKNGVESKPSPTPYLNTIKMLGSASQDTLIFEDSVAGIAAATASGASVVQISCFTKKPILTTKAKNFKRL